MQSYLPLNLHLLRVKGHGWLQLSCEKKATELPKHSTDSAEVQRHPSPTPSPCIYSLCFPEAVNSLSQESKRVTELWRERVKPREHCWTFWDKVNRTAHAVLEQPAPIVSEEISDQTRCQIHKMWCLQTLCLLLSPSHRRCSQQLSMEGVRKVSFSVLATFFYGCQKKTDIPLAKNICSRSDRLLVWDVQLCDL